MKRFYLLVITALILSFPGMTQVPHAFKYQAVARDASGNVLVNQQVGIELGILAETANGTAVYKETHTAQTNAHGLISLEVGHGTVTLGDFSLIDWFAHDYFIEVAIDATGGSNYQVMGSSQLLSVPYALNAGNVANVNDADADPTNELIQGAELSGTNLILNDAAGTHTVDLSSMLIMTDSQGNRWKMGVDTNGNLTTTKIRAKIMVISDPHYFEPSLLISDGPAFQTYLAHDRKLIAESHAIMEASVNSILAEMPDIVILPGDLTKDGEKLSHEGVASFLQQLEAAGIQVFVCPGNHDVNNPHSFSYDYDTVYHVPSVTPQEFETIYGNFGFNEAIYSDPNSLSYVAEPMEDLWILSMDVCDYDTNFYYPTTHGRFKPETLAWVEERLQEAEANGKMVLGMMHHGLMEHYMGQATLFWEYVVMDYENVSTLLAQNGLKVVFTGHYHAQDIVKKTVENDFIFDIETGSTVTSPCPLRVIHLTDNNMMEIISRKIETINYPIPGNIPFQKYAHEYMVSGITLIAKYMLMAPPYSLPEELATMLSPVMGEAFAQHYGGDESAPTPQSQAIIDVLLNSGDPMQIMLGQAIMAIFMDLPPADNTVTIDLNTGSTN
ncbi:MAG: metallophosphoesterase [Bacteroidetes bacterium]|nr:metallophosphoesterase [Bacteroidota bacterium]